MVDVDAKLAALAALREGRRLEEVATAYGVTPQAFYAARRRDPLFEAAWRDAHALGAAAERDPAAGGRGSPPARMPSEEGEEGEERIVPNNRRGLQRRRMRNVRFDEKRRQIFLSHFAWTCDGVAAAAAAGVAENTVYNCRRRDSVFAAEFQEALEQGYARLEAEALRQRLEAQRRLREAVEAAGAEGGALPAAELAGEFERVMKLLARWDRRHGRVGPREVSMARERPYSFDEAIAMLEDRLRALGFIKEPPPDDEEPEAA